MPSTAMYFILGLLLLCALAAAVGLVEARAKNRSAFGWIVSVVASIIGAVGGAMAVGAAMDASGAFKETGPAFDTLPMIAGLLLGAWLALKLVNRFRDRDG